MLHRRWPMFLMHKPVDGAVAALMYSLFCWLSLSACVCPHSAGSLWCPELHGCGEYECAQADQRHFALLQHEIQTKNPEKTMLKSTDISSLCHLVVLPVLIFSVNNVLVSLVPLSIEQFCPTFTARVIQHCCNSMLLLGCCCFFVLMRFQVLLLLEKPQSVLFSVGCIMTGPVGILWGERSRS